MYTVSMDLQVLMRDPKHESRQQGILSFTFATAVMFLINDALISHGCIQRDLDEVTLFARMVDVSMLAMLPSQSVCSSSMIDRSTSHS